MGSHRCAWLLWSAFVMGFFATAPLYGQQAAPDNDNVNGTASSENPEAPESRDEIDSELWERLIYLPYKNLKDVLDKHGATVVVPYLEYLKLWERSSGGMRPVPDGPAIPAVLTKSHYQAHVDGELARIDASLTVHVLGRSGAELPLRFGEAAVGGVSGSDDRILLRGTGDGSYSLLLPEPGEHTVRLELLTRVRSSPQGRSFQLECPPVGITTLDLLIPEPDQTVNVTPHLVSLPVRTAGDSSEGAEQDGPAAAEQTRVRASLGATNRITARWHPRAGLKPQMDLLVRVNNLLNVSFEEGLAHFDAALQYQVLRGELIQLRIAVPAGHRILDVSAPEAQVKGWRAVEEGSRQIVTVDLLSPVDDTTTIEVHTETPTSEQTTFAGGIDEDGTVHGIHALDVVRENGQLAVSQTGDLSLTVQQQQRIVRLEEGEVAEALRRPGALYYKFYSPDFRLVVAARPLEPRIAVQQQTRLVFREDELQLLADLTYDVQKAGVFELRLRLPEDLDLDSVTSEPMTDYRLDDGTRVLTVVLDQKRQGEIPISVRAHRSLESEDRTDSASPTQSLPVLEPLDVDRETGSVSVYAPEAIEVITDDANLVGVHPDPGEGGPGRVGGARLDDVRLASSWSYSRRPINIPVRTERKPTRLTAQVGTTINVRQELIEVETLLEYLVEHAGVTRFRFQVPEAVADRVQIEPVGPANRDSGGRADGVRQISRAEQAQDGWITWTVAMQQEVLGRQRFRVRWDVKPDRPLGVAPANNGANGDGPDGPPTAPVEVTLQALRALGLENEDNGESDQIPLSGVVGELAVVKDRALSVSAEAAGGDVEPIDVRELDYLPQSGTLALRYHQGPVEVTLTVSKHEIQPVVETVVSKALVEAVIGRDATATYRCRYRIKSSERQRLRVDLPRGFEPLGVFVDGVLVNLERVPPSAPAAAGESRAAPADGWEAFNVNVARAKSAEEPFSLTLQYRLSGGLYADQNMASESSDGGLRRSQAQAGPAGRRDVSSSPFERSGGGLVIPLPRIGGASPSHSLPGNGGLSGGGGVVVQRLRTMIWVPERFWLVGAPERFVRESSYRLRGLLWGRPDPVTSNEDLEAWIGTSAPAFFDFPTEGHHVYRFSSLGAEPVLQVAWWDVPFFTWVLSGAIFFIAIVLRNTPWENKLGFVLLVTFVAALIALEYPDWVLHGLTAARFGLVGLVVLWLIHGLAAGRADGPHTEATAGRWPPMSIVGRDPHSAIPAVVPPPGVFEEQSRLNDE